MILFDLLSWWQSLQGPAQVFWAMGLISNVLFAIYLVIQITGGHDGDVGSPDTDGDPGWAILSIRSLMAFGMFTGYTGVVCLHLGLGWFVALLVGIIAGVFAAWLAWRLLRLLLRMQTSGTLDLQNAIGQTGHVHLQIPAREHGAGKVMVEVQGALRELDAVSEQDEIATGTSVLVVGLTDDGLLIVQPFQVQPGNKVAHMLITV